MADKFNDSNHSSLLVVDQYIINRNPLSFASAFIGSWGSSFSYLNTSFGSEQDSSEVDNDDGDEFVAELTRKMVDYMLQEDDDDNSYDKYTSPKGYVSQKPISEVKHPNKNRVTGLLMISCSRIRNIVDSYISIWNRKSISSTFNVYGFENMEQNRC
ncbi:uncharacterized protein LOC111888991 [Lactuca sativa]|uniref:uncharacterized protein LOC111888991 n=1 Tax=Lactuca sativa TaxID=4236 RepID=UPI000CD9AE67|nr:uncharacterized protein LOC111888991 [Lactuca sativa]